MKPDQRHRMMHACGRKVQARASFPAPRLFWLDGGLELVLWDAGDMEGLLALARGEAGV